MLDSRQTANPDQVMLAGKVKNTWQLYTSDQFKMLTDHLSRALLAQGFQKGDKIGLISGNRPEWNVVDFACCQLGVVTVPLYPTLSTQDLAYILKNAGVKLLFASNQALTDHVKEAVKKEGIPLTIYTFDVLPGLPSYASLLEEGAQLDTDLTPLKNAVSPDDLLTLIYTSGTTGKPKGVLLSHRNILSNVEASQHILPKNTNKALSFLPLCHIFERMVVYIYLSNGVSVYYAENLDNIVNDINEVKPTIFACVPRVLEKIYDKIIEKGKALAGIKKALFFWAIRLGLRYQEPSKNGVLYRLQLKLARKLIFSKWRHALGGHLQLIVSGGAALQERLSRVFWAAGIPILEGYGLTETSPVIAVNGLADDAIKFGTVGRPLQNLTVKIAADGEVLVKGPSVSAGYYQNEAATRETIDENGFFHTGDIGTLTSDGFLKITDRKKEMFKTAGGKYIAPQTLENKLMESVLIAQVMVVGENQRFPAALIVPDSNALKKFCQRKRIPFTSLAELVKEPKVIQKYQTEIDRVNAGLGHWEAIKKFVLLSKEWSIADGELTPKLSLKRKVILKNNEDIINQVYEEHE